MSNWINNVKIQLAKGLKGDLRLANKQANKPGQRKKSKRERRVKFVVFLMIIAMLLSSLTTGLVMFL